jgi:hypothetical protein
MLTIGRGHGCTGGKFDANARPFNALARSGQRELPEFLWMTAVLFNELSCATAQEKKNQKDGDWDPYKP